MTRSQAMAAKKQHMYNQKMDYLHGLDEDKKRKIDRKTNELFKHCLDAGIGTEPSTCKPYIPNGMVSSETAWQVCYVLAAAEVCPDYPYDFQDQDCLERFLEQLSNVGFNTEGEPIAVIEELQTPELKNKQDYLKALSLTTEWRKLYLLEDILFQYFVSRWLGGAKYLFPERLAQYICRQIAAMRLFPDYPITTQDWYVEQYFHSFIEKKLVPFDAEVISSFDKAISTLHQWIEAEKSDHHMTNSSPPQTIPEPFVKMMGTKYWEGIATPKQLWVWIAKMAVSKINNGPDRYTIPELEAIKNLVNGGDLSEKDCLQMTAWCSARLQALESADSAKEAA